MKKLLLVLLALPMLYGCNQKGNIADTKLFDGSQNVDIPDANFKAYLVGNTNINTNGDTEIQVSEATAFNGTMFCDEIGISNLTGIEAFTALTYLYCESNQLTSLNVSLNTALTGLSCGNNQLTSLNVSQNTALTSLFCQENPLGSLNVSLNTALTVLSCGYNQLTSLDVSLNTALTYLWCVGNQLTSLDVSQNTALTILICGGNQLTSLDVSQNTALTYLSCGENQLTSLDVSQNTALTILYCWDNQLTSLDVRNGNNTNFYLFYAYGNPNLYCIDVDDASYSTYTWGNIDPQSYFSNNCGSK
jgi:Leucine-rich repeat (LRR) protein